MKQRRQKQQPDRRKDRNAAPNPPADSPPNAKRQWLFRLLALVLLPVLTFGVLEIVLRLFGYGYPTSFFLTQRVGDQEFIVNNEAYGDRFFPSELARFSGPIRIAAQKPADTFRIYILGESAAMGDPEPSFGASRYLEVLLRERYPRQKFEVVNVAITAINSHVILPIARDCARHPADLWIIYMGNNEMVGPFGAATVFGAKAPPLALVRLSLAIQETRSGQLLMALARKLKSKSNPASTWGGMEMFVSNRLAPDAPARQTVYSNFQRNLRDILTAGLDSGARVVLNTVAVNLKDCPPFASISNSNLPPSDRATFDKLYADGVTAFSQSNYTTAAQLFDQAARLDPKFAELQYRWGLSLLDTPERPNLAAAREHLQLACDTDALPFRTDSRINGVIRQEAKELANPKLVLLDAASILATNDAAGVCGQETFYEHVHFNFEGNYRLGLLWAQQVEQALPASARAHAAAPWNSQQTCDRLLGLSAWNRILVLHAVERRFAQAPLSGQFNNAVRQQAIKNRVAELSGQTSAQDAEQARKDFDEAIKHAPEDHYLHEVFAEFLQATGDMREATRQWQRVHEILPQDFLSYYQLGRLYSQLGSWREADDCLMQVVSAHPGMVEAWYELGNVHADEGNYERALADYNQALKRRPRDSRTLCAMGKALAKLTRRAEAIEKFRQAIRLNPDYGDAHFELGGELAFDEKFGEAQTEFAEAVRLQPGNPRAHFNLGVTLARQKRYDEAAHEFQETLRLEPANQTAAVYLAEVNKQKVLGAHTP